ncbi:hypothetical protein B0H14DRAFT_2964414, partial [Mycena olivaceomarginata]
MAQIFTLTFILSAYLCLSRIFSLPVPSILHPQYAQTRRSFLGFHPTFQALAHRHLAQSLTQSPLLLRTCCRQILSTRRLPLILWHFNEPTPTSRTRFCYARFPRCTV